MIFINSSKNKTNFLAQVFPSLVRKKSFLKKNQAVEWRTTLTISKILGVLLMLNHNQIQACPAIFDSLCSVYGGFNYSHDDASSGEYGSSFGAGLHYPYFGIELTYAKFGDQTLEGGNYSLKHQFSFYDLMLQYRFAGSKYALIPYLSAGALYSNTISTYTPTGEILNKKGKIYNKMGFGTEWMFKKHWAAFWEINKTKDNGLFQSDNLHSVMGIKFKWGYKEVVPPKPKPKPTLPTPTPFLIVLFDTDKHFVKYPYRMKLKKYADKIKGSKEYILVVSGFADIRGTNNHNQKLSKRRANAVKNVLKNSGFMDEQIKLFSYGETKISDALIEKYSRHIVINKLQKQRRVTVQIFKKYSNK